MSSVTGIKTMNDVEALYDKGVLEKGDKFICPVCDKEYKRKNAAEAHIEKRDCFSLKDMFNGTVHETRAYGIYKDLIGQTNPQATVNLRKFRNSPYFNGSIRLTLFLAVHTLTDQKDNYMAWLNEFKGCTKMGRLLSESVKESNLREFRRFLRHFEKFIDSKSYYDKYKDSLIYDGDFFIRTLETAKIGVKFLMEQKDFPFEEVMKHLNADQQYRFEELANDLLTNWGI